jgi:riboflavin kinase/FMN adenylyltransferase
LLAQLRKDALRLGLPLLVVLFEPQPAEFFLGSSAPVRLSRLREKLDMLRACGVDFVYCLKFDTKAFNMVARDFAEQILFSLLRVRYLLIGPDFRFGYKREGDIRLLERLAPNVACDVQEYPDYLIENQRVSSTQVRQAFQQGDMVKAEALLGRTFRISGRVVHGEALARKWGVPTANIHLSKHFLPLRGVFCVQVRRHEGELLHGVANIGNRPTIGGRRNLLEVHLFDFDDLIYGERLEVFFLQRLREEIKFPSIDELVTQIKKDVLAARSYFNNEYDS